MVNKVRGAEVKRKKLAHEAKEEKRKNDNQFSIINAQMDMELKVFLW